MKLLVLGGSGFVSGHLARMAQALGHQVWCLTRGQRASLQGIRYLRADRNDEKGLLRVLEDTGVQFDAVMDCICFDREQAGIDLRVLPRFTKQAVVISTDSVYHPAHKAVPQAEESDHYMQDGGYGCKKRQMEEAFLADPGPLPWTLLRPGHIFGPGSEIGCFPEHSRQKNLLSHMRQDQPLRLVGGGKYLIHPIYVEDLCRCMLACVGNPACYRQIFCVGGPDIVENAQYYEIIGSLIGHPARIESIPEEGYLAAHPEFSGHLCHRAYSLEKLKNAGVPLPDTHLADGLKRQIEWLDSRDHASSEA